MTIVTQIEIICRQFDKTANKNDNGKRPMLTRQFISSDSHGQPRFFDQDKKAFVDALYRALDDNVVDAVYLLGVLMIYDRDKRLEEKAREE